MNPFFKNHFMSNAMLLDFFQHNAIHIIYRLNKYGKILPS